METMMNNEKEIVCFNVKGEIKTKLRPKATIIGGHARVYTPKDTIMYENLIRTEYRRQCNDYSFGTKPLAVIIRCYFQMSKQLSEFGEYSLKTPCVTHKDLDNICKLVDALNGIAWKDDKQIVTLHAEKAYTLNDERIEISIIDMTTEYDFPEIDDLKKRKRKDKLEQRKSELESKDKLNSVERNRLAEIVEMLEKGEY